MPTGSRKGGGRGEAIQVPGPGGADRGCDDDGPFRPGGRQQLVTMRLAGDDVASYFGIGGHFDLWLGDDIGQGIVTRRLFV